MKRLAASLLVPSMICFWACSSNNPSKTEGPCEGGRPCVDGSVEAATVVADARGDGPVACANRFDCSSLSHVFNPSSDQNLVPCCMDNLCRLEMFDDDCTDASAQIIQASNYDQSRATDADCVFVAEGNFCYPGATNCANAAISKSAHAQYQADVAKTRAASCYAPGNCGAEFGPCCVSGMCQVGKQCGNLASDASAETSADAATCPSVARECADAASADLGCATTWSTAQQPSTWCPKVPYARVFTAPHCDGFDIVVLGATDTSSFYYYDLQTGALVGIEGHGNNGTLCIAGQAPNVPLTDCYDAGGVVTVSCEADGSFSD